MSSIVVEPWFAKADYDLLRQSAVDNLDLPGTYDEWLDLVTQRIANFEARGIVPHKVIINPREFAAYCVACGLEQNAVMLGGFAVKKAVEKHKL